MVDSKIMSILAKDYFNNSKIVIFLFKNKNSYCLFINVIKRGLMMKQKRVLIAGSRGMLGKDITHSLLFENKYEILNK